MKHAPWQIWLVDPEGVRPTRKWVVHKKRWALVVLFTAALVFGAGLWLGHRISDANALAYELARTQREVRALEEELARWQAKAELKEKAARAMERELAHMQAEIADLRDRIAMYERILDARKGKGVQIVDWRIEPLEKGWRWRVILVKGGNYPRWVAGTLKVDAQDQGGRWMAVTPTGGLRYEMESHTVLAGEWTPPAGFRPVVWRALVRDRLGRIVAEARKTTAGERDVQKAPRDKTREGSNDGD